MDDYIRCQNMVATVGRWLDGDIDEARREPFEMHLLVCPLCLDYVGKVRRLRTTLASLATESVPEALLVEVWGSAR